MISILINPNCPELIFAAAAMVLRFEQQYPKEFIDAIPLYPADFKKSLPEIYDNLTANIERYEKKFLSESMRYGLGDMEMDLYPDKIVLLGIHPSNKEEADNLIQFFERESDNILLWLDNHSWPPGLVNFFQSQNKNIIVAEKEYLLNLTNVYFPPEIHATEQAIMNKWRGNPMARRYWKAYRQVKISYGDFEKVGLFSFFHMAIDEIIFSEENILLTILSEEYSETMIRTIDALKRISTNHPMFSEAKKYNRPIGFVSVRGLEIVDMEKLIKEGLKRCPWLIVIEVGTNEEPFLKLESEKIPIEDILTNYTDIFERKLSAEQIMAAVNKIVVGYQEHIAV